MIANILGLLIGLLAVFGTLLLILIVVIMDNKSRRIRTQLLHDERMLALEKGLPVPHELGDFGRKRRPYVRGLVFLAVGAGLMVFGGITNDNEVVGFGSIPALIGIALILADKFAKPANGSKRKETSPYAGADYPAASQENQT
jgi:hypothetical protein